MPDPAKGTAHLRDPSRVVGISRGAAHGHYSMSAVYRSAPVTLFGRRAATPCSDALSGETGGKGWIRTNAGVNHRIYSPALSATQPPSHGRGRASAKHGHPPRTSAALRQHRLSGCPLVAPMVRRYRREPTPNFPPLGRGRNYHAVAPRSDLRDAVKPLSAVTP